MSARSPRVRRSFVTNVRTALEPPFAPELGNAILAATRWCIRRLPVGRTVSAWRDRPREP